jgi:hypothetical protein
VRWRRIRWSDVAALANACRKNVDAGRSLGSDFVFRICRHDALSGQAPKHCINLLGRRLRPAVEPPSQHGHGHDAHRSLCRGRVSSLGTEWGLFRHYWVLVKLLLTIPLTILLLVHTQPVSYMAGVGVQRALSGADLGGLRIQLAAYAAAALLVLFVATTLSVYRPRA